MRTRRKRPQLQPALRLGCPGCMQRRRQFPADMSQLVACADAVRAPRNPKFCCRLRTSSGSRHCSLRVLQLVVGDDAASPHAQCAGRGRCASRDALRSLSQSMLRNTSEEWPNCCVQPAAGLAPGFLGHKSPHWSAGCIPPSSCRRRTGGEESGSVHWALYFRSLKEIHQVTPSKNKRRNSNLSGQSESVLG